MVFLSVVIPVYNVEKYIYRCINSLVEQSCFDEIEVLLIDDGSTDKSGVICDEYASMYSNIQVFHKVNGGLSDARNHGLLHTTGEYVFFLDSDDFVTDNFIVDIKRLIEQEKPELINFNYCFEKKYNEYKICGNKNVKIENAYEHLLLLLKCKVGNQICFNVYKRVLFSDISFPVGRVYEDISTYYKLIINSNKILKVNYTYYVYNISNSSSITKTTNFSNMRDMYLAVNQQYNTIGQIYYTDRVMIKYLTYYKLDKYIYIFLKLYRETTIRNDEKWLIKDLLEYIEKHKEFNFISYRHYNLKKYLYVICLKFLGKLF